MADNKVKVRIFGQEYTISGERDEQDIVEVANYVDAKMKEMAHCFTPGQATGSIPVLACVNIADEYFAHKHDNDSLKAKNAQLEKDVENYMRMWNEAKNNAAHMKEGAERTSGDIQALQEKIKELEAKVNETESLYFDVQMENIQLKDKLSKLQG